MAALRPFTDSFEEQLTCSLCLDVFTDPKTLPCLHSFCTRCIAHWYETSGNPFNNQMDCPMCKTAIDVPDGDPTKLRSSFYLDSLLQLLHAMKTKTDQPESKPELPYCVKCEETQGLAAFCAQCNGLICEACFNAHKLFKEVEDEHQPMMLNQFKEENVNSFIKNQMLCNIHEKKKLKYYCQTCVRCICQKCATLHHENGHQKQSLEEAGQDAEKWILAQTHRVEQRLEKREHELEQSKENLARIIRENEVAARDVDDVVDTICNMAKEHGIAMKNKLKETLQELTTANNEEQEMIKLRIKHLLEYRNHCEAVTSRNVPYDMIQSKELIQQGCQMLSDTPSVLPIERDTRVRYQANCQSLQLLQDMGKILKIVTSPENSTIESIKEVRCGFLSEFNIIIRNSEGEVCPTRIESIDARIKDVEGNEVEKKVSEEKPGKYRVSFRPQRTGPHEIQVNIGGQRIKNSPQNVNIHDVKEEFKLAKIFERVSEDEIRVLDEPKSVSHSEKGEIVVVNRKDHRIEMFSLDGEHLRQFGSKGSGEGQLNKPFGVVFHENTIVVSDGLSDGKGRIQEFDLNGTYVRTIYRPEQWFVPRGMCVNDDQNIAVCCLGNQDLGIKPSIKVFSKQGDLVHEFDMPDNEQPRYITYGNGKYFVSCANDGVRVFDVNGDFLNKYGDKGERGGQFDGVCGLAVYGPDMILVCDYENNCVKLFTQDGEFLSSFGHFGSGYCQMVCPTDLTITADGHVFVLECMNNRVQVWY